MCQFPFTISVMRVSAWLAAVMSVVACTAACSRANDSAVGGGATAVPVTTAAAEPGSIAAIIQTAGVITPALGAEQTVTAPEQARIIELTKVEGEPVMKGDALVKLEIESDTLDTAQENAKLATAEAHLENARASHAKAKELFDRGLAPRMNVDNAQTQITAAEVELRAARTAAAETGAGRETRSLIRAAFDGVVEKRLKNVGDAVPFATAILVVVDPNRLEVSAPVPHAEAMKINVGNPARIMTPEGAPGPSLQVVARPDSVDQSVPVNVRLAFDAPPGMPVGLSVPLAIVGEVHDSVTLVPRPAVLYDGDAPYVFVVSNGTVQRVPVTVGITNDTHAEITSGVELGTIVVIDAEGDLFDGAKVTVR